MMLNNQGRLVLNNQKNPSLHNEPQIPPGFVKKQPLEVFCKKGVLKIFLKFTGKRLPWSLLQACNFIKKRLQHWCFPVKFAKFLRTSILKSTCKILLPFVSPQNTIAKSIGELGLGETLTKCKVSFMKQNHFIRLSNAAISFIYELKNISLTCQLTFFLNFCTF